MCHQEAVLAGNSEGDGCRKQGEQVGALWSRIYAPIRCEGLLLGYLFFIDDDETCGPRELALAKSAAHTAGMILYQQQLLHEVERARERELVQDLLNGDLALRQNVAAEIIERGHLEHTPGVVVMVPQPATSADNNDGPASVSDLRFAVTAALEDVRRGISPRHSRRLDRPGHGVLLIVPMMPPLATETSESSPPTCGRP